MSLSLSFVFPVHNAEATLASDLRHVLELLADLSTTFELLVIDDGSHDDTIGEARELERRFAQLRVIHRPLHYGHSAAVQLGIRKARGRFVMIYNDRSRPVTTEIYDLWQARHDSSVGHGRGHESRQPAQTSDLSIAAHGTVLELGALILVHRLPDTDLRGLANFVRDPWDDVLAGNLSDLAVGPHFHGATTSPYSASARP